MEEFKEYRVDVKKRKEKFHPRSGLSVSEVRKIISEANDWKELIRKKLTIQDLLIDVKGEDNYWKTYFARRYLWAKIRDDTFIINEMDDW